MLTKLLASMKSNKNGNWPAPPQIFTKSALLASMKSNKNGNLMLGRQSPRATPTFGFYEVE